MIIRKNIVVPTCGILLIPMLFINRVTTGLSKLEPCHIYWHLSQQSISQQKQTYQQWPILDKTQETLRAPSYFFRLYSSTENSLEILWKTLRVENYSSSVVRSMFCSSMKQLEPLSLFSSLSSLCFQLLYFPPAAALFATLPPSHKYLIGHR